MFQQVRLPAVAAGSPRSPQSSAPDSLPANRSTANKPALVDRAADYDIPAQLWSRWKENGKARAICRPIVGDELNTLQRRAVELQEATSPMMRHEEDTAVAAISSMLGGFRSMRQTEQEAAAVLDGIRRCLDGQPLWAIEMGCAAIQRGDAAVDGRKLDRRYAPNDSEIFGVVDAIVEPYRLSLQKLTALLSAPIEPPTSLPAQAAEGSASATHCNGDRNDDRNGDATFHDDREAATR